MTCKQFNRLWSAMPCMNPAQQMRAAAQLQQHRQTCTTCTYCNQKNSKQKHLTSTQH